jgi:hypothetical protein
MIKRLKALLFILLIVGGTLASTPLSNCHHECVLKAHDKMGMMECCRKSHAIVDAHLKLGTKLCCANCEQPAPTISTTYTVQRDLKSYLVMSDTPVLTLPNFTLGLYSYQITYLDPSISKPTYILHQALLI